jgi:hypothetical protein
MCNTAFEFFSLPENCHLYGDGSVRAETFWRTYYLKYWISTFTDSVFCWWLINIKLQVHGICNSVIKKVTFPVPASLVFIVESSHGY